MTRKLTFLILALFALMASPGWGQSTATATLTTADYTWTCTNHVTSQIVNGITFSFSGGSTDPTYYAADGLRTYEGCNITISSENTISEIVFTYTISNSGCLKNPTVGTWNNSTKTWTGNANSIGLTVGHSSGSKNGQVRITQIVVTYSAGDTPSITVTDNVTLDYDATEGQFGYSISNPTTGVNMTASTENSWISNIIVNESNVTFTTTENEAQTQRVGTITLSYTGATSKVVTVTQAAAPEEGLLFYESFDTNNGTGGNDDKWSGSIASNDLTSDNIGWTFVKGNGANKCAKFGSASEKGSAKTPSISCNGNATLSFKAAAWNGSSEKTTLNISATSGTLSQASVTLVKGAWTEYSIDITNVTNSTQITFEANNASNNRFFLDEVKVLEAEAPSVATPTFTPAAGTYYEAQNVTIECETVGAAIYYTIDGSTPTNASTLYTSAIAVNETTTIKAIAYLNDKTSSVASATYTINIPVTLTTMDEIFAKATAVGTTATNVYVTFNNWVISGVKSSNAYLTDGTKGLIIYESDHGFAVGDKLSGTVACKVQLYNGAAELTSLTSETTGLTVTEDGVISPVTMTIDQITSGVYTGAVITIENVTYNSSDELLSDGTNTIKPYNKLYSDMSFTNDKEYNVTGVYLQYNNTKEIMPRNAEDIYLIPATEYDILLYQPMYGGGTISADKEKAAADETVTLTAIPDTHYHFAGWIVYYGLGEEIIVDENNQFIMPASVVTISAFFAEDAMYSAAYYYNGVSVHYSDPMYAGPIGTLYDPTDMTPPAGFSFVGWSTSMASTEPIDETYTISSDIDLYAIFEKASTSRDGSEDCFVKVTEAPEDWSGEYLLVYEGGESNGVPVPAVAWTGVDAGGCGAEVSITSNAIAEKPEAAATLTIAPMEGGYSIRVDGGDNDGKYIGRTADSNGLNFTSEAQLNTLAITDGEAVITAAGGRTMKYNYATNNLRFRYYGSGQQPVQLYKKSESASSAIGRYTRVYDNAYPATGSLLSVEGPSIIVSGYILDIYSVDNDNEANLIIEDGAQLIQYSSNVMATVQKNITGYTDPEGNDGYYLIANPTEKVQNDGYDALDGCAQFDLYTFDPTEQLEWRNQVGTASRVPFTRTVGYLFAVPSDRTISFRGSLLSAGETEITLVRATEGAGIDFPGFNLIGNPYACNAYPTDEGDNFMSYYKMNEDGNELELVDNIEAVTPCEGFFVEAAENNQKIYLTTETPVTVTSLLNITVSQNRGNVIDRAIVNFDGRNNLHKFMMNPAHTNLSIAKGGETFAAISTEAEGELPVNFKAEKNGTYTITVNTENVEANYLHLIDNLTGMDTDLLSTPSYTFDAKTSDYASRFKLVFSMNDVESNQVEANSFAYINNGEIIISNEGRATLQVIDVMGRIISSEEINGECRISTNGMTAGVYVLNLNGNVQKIVVR